MRIACIHIPQYALQCATRVDPSLRGAPVAMVAGQAGGTGPLHAPIVVACSRAAWALGIRLGMTAVTARRLASALTIVSAEPLLERETARGVADALLALTGVVDVGGRVGAGGAHLALYAEVPVKMRGASFGERALERLAELGLVGRVGIADDRFTAWVAAAYGASGDAIERRIDQSDEARDRTIIVPRGGSAAFLAPRSLALLGISPEVLHMYDAFGVRTLGELAALPAPSIARPLDVDYQALARGDSGTRLRPYAPEGAPREEIVVRGNVLDGDGAIGCPSAIALIAQRLALRLAGRERVAAELAVSLIAGDGVATERAIAIDAMADADELARALSPVLDAAPLAPWRLRVAVTTETAAGAPAVVSAPYAVPATDAQPSRAAEPSLVDPLVLVLASPGGLFALAPGPDPASRSDLERIHRRTRRGKHRRMRPSAALELFERPANGV